MKGIDDGNEIRENIKTSGAFYHVKLAPGTVLNEKIAGLIAEAVDNNIDKIIPPPGGRYDLPIKEIL